MRYLKTLFVVFLTLAICRGLGVSCWAEAEGKVHVAPTWDRGTIVRVALLPVEAGEKQQKGTARVRRSLYGQLLSIPEFHLVEPVAVDRLLEQAGLMHGDAWKEARPETLGRVLGVDYLLYPKLTAWSQKYMLLQANTNVAVEAEVVEADSGKTVYKAESKATFRKGLTGIPTGTAALALEPIRGMSDRFLYDGAYETTAGIVAPLDPAQEVGSTELSGERRLDITHAEMEFENRVLTVEMKGTPSCTASFFVKRPDRLFPLSEIEPGVYRGQYLIPEGAAFDPSHVSIRLIASDGGSVVGEVS